MRGIYLAACKARHPNYNIIYQDIDSKYKCDIGGDMLEVSLDEFDYIIATPPCNFWSRANPYYLKSIYANKTKHLLPHSIVKLWASGKPFIIENVINKNE